MFELLPPSFGRALTDIRAGWENIAYNRFNHPAAAPCIQVQSLAFADHAPLPAKYTADGEGEFPPLCWQDVPERVVAFALVVEDADAPLAHPLLHLAALNLPPYLNKLDAGGITELAEERAYLAHAWTPPDPPPGHGQHRYAFQVFGLREPVPANLVRREKLLMAIAERCIAKGMVVGTYERDNLQKVSPTAKLAPVVAR